MLLLLLLHFGKSCWACCASSALLLAACCPEWLRLLRLRRWGWRLPLDGAACAALFCRAHWVLWRSALLGLGASGVQLGARRRLAQRLRGGLAARGAGGGRWAAPSLLLLLIWPCEQQ